MHELFIYYRVDAAHAAEATTRVLTWQREIGSAQPALRDARLLKRPGAQDGWHTWMETYVLLLAPTGDDTVQLHGRLSRGPEGLRGWIDGERHLEVFVPCA